MRWTCSREGALAALAWVTFTACTFGQVSIGFNGSTQSPLQLGPGDAITFNVNGPAGGAFAALISPEGHFEVTPYGILLANPAASEAWIFYDGFDPASPTFATAKIPPDGSPFTQVFVPFVWGGAYATAYHIQAIVADPAHPLGAALTNELVITYDVPAPVVTAIGPNFASPLTPIQIYGSDFATDPAANVVRLNGITCQVLSATATALTIVVPADARSGAISVETPNGTSLADPDSMQSWLAVAPAAFYDEGSVPPVITGPTSVLGTLLPLDGRDFVVHLEPGEEIVAEAYVFNPTQFAISGQANPATAYFDPVLLVRRNPLQPITVLTDDDAGPNVSAGIGLAIPSPHYVADAPEDIVVRIESQLAFSGGPYLVLLSTRVAQGLPVTVQHLFPSNVRTGDAVTIVGTGFDPAHPEQHTVILNGATVVPQSVTLSSVHFIVPEGARSGPVAVAAPAATSAYDFDRMQSWLCIHAYTELYESEGLTPTIPAGCLVRGTIYPANDVDDYQIDLVAGQTVSIECHAWDSANGCITTAAILSNTPVDPEVRIIPGTAVFPIIGFDQNSGPGLSAAFGVGFGTAAFAAPYTAAFRIRVSAFFNWSYGDYVLAVNPVP